MPDVDDNQPVLGGAVIGAVYGVVAAMTQSLNDITAVNVILTTVIGGVLFACVASALCRCGRVWRMLAESSNDVFRDI